MAFCHLLRLHPIALSMLIVFLGNSDGEIIQQPSEVTAMVGQGPVYLNCSTSEIPQTHGKWSVTLHGTGEVNRKYIYDGGRIAADFEDRFGIDINETSGAFNLVLRDPQTKDAGSYQCTDSDDHPASAELTVLDSDWVCESNMDPRGVVGPNECDEAIPPDDIQPSCNATFFGKSIPDIEFRANGNPVATTRMAIGNKLVCKAAMEATRHRELSVSVCVKGTQHCNHAPNASVPKLLYAFANDKTMEYHTGDEVTCVADASEQLRCSYTWYKDNKMTQVSSNALFKPNEPGLYICQAKCMMRNASCTITAKMIYASKSGWDVKLIVFIVLFAMSFAVNIGFMLRIWCKIRILDICSKLKQYVPSCNGQQNGHATNKSGVASSNELQNGP